MATRAEVALVAGNPAGASQEDSQPRGKAGESVLEGSARADGAGQDVKSVSEAICCLFFEAFAPRLRVFSLTLPPGPGR